MRKLIAAINMTLDGICDHTAVDPDEEIHNHYTELIANAGAMIYGRITYQLMESFWPTLVKNPSGDKSMDDFAVAMESIPKIVFSTTLKSVDWESARLATRSIKEEILDLKQQPGNNVFVGSPSLIMATLQLDLIDELQLCIHPIVAGSGAPLFKNIQAPVHLKLQKTKKFACGAVIHYYQPTKSDC